MPPTRETSQRQSVAAPRVGSFLLWLSVLGGTAGWALHLIAAWATVELACYQGESTILGLPLRGFAGVATAVPLLIAAVSLAAVLRFNRNLARPAPEGSESRFDRARFMAQVGVWLNILAIVMIVFGGVAVAWLAPCGT